MNFATIDTERFLDKRSRLGDFTIDSESIRATGYIIKDSTVTVVGGKNGMLSIGIAEAETFMEELKKIFELAKECKNRRVKGI